MKSNQDKSTKSKLQIILEKYGKAIHDMIVGYPDSPEITMAGIGETAGVSRESVRLWINTIYGTTRKRKPKQKWPTIIQECVPELMEYSFEPIRSKFYKIVETGKLVLVRKGSWKKIGVGGANEYFALLYPPSPKPDLIVIVVNRNERYVIPPIPGIRKVVCLSKKTVQLCLNRFDYINSSPDKVPILNAGRGQSIYRGVLKLGNSFKASVSVDGENINLGTYEMEDVAAFVYDKAVLYFCPKKVRTNGLSKEAFEEKELARLIRSFWPKKSCRFIGVHKRKYKFRAQIGYNKKYLYLGLFDSETEAAKAYNKKAVELHGKKATLNII